MNRTYHIISIASLLLLAGACDFFKGIEDEEDNGPAVARVYDSYLYQSELDKVLPSSLSKEDSISFVQNYINVWAKNELMIYKAEFNLSEEQKQFEEQIENYRNDLLKFAYLQKYVSDRIDTTITDAEIKTYYEENQENFQLKENILRLRYISVPTDAPDIEDLKELFQKAKEDSEDQQELIDYALSYARNFALEDTAWINFRDFRRLIPIRSYNQQEFLSRNQYVEIEDDGLFYLAEISEYKIKDNPSPLVYVQDVIRNTLLNKRRLTLIADLEKNLLNDALKKKEFETYP